MSNYHYLKLVISFFGLFLFNTSYAQQNSGGVPISFQKKTDFSGIESHINSIVLPVINNEAEQQRADSIATITCTDCDNQYYGKGLDVAIDIKNQGQLEVLEDNSKLWLLKIESSTAYGMQFYFDKFKLPEGARLFIFNEDRTMVLGSFTASNNSTDESKPIKFGTQYIEGKSIFIEYNEPSAPEFEGEVSITKIIHIFKNIISKSGPFGSSGACNINVSCPEGFGWEKEINSIALILGYDNNNDLMAWCSGALINNTSEDGRALFLTANHCIDGNSVTNPLFDYSTWLFLFNHQTKTCSSDGSDISSYTGQSVYGSQLLAKDGAESPTSDYLLLDLNTSEQVLASYGACYAGWSLTSSPQPPFTGIHHPSGDVKKISIDQSPTESTFYNNYQPTNQGNHWKINWDNGTTEGGSSGSPLFDNNHRIVGQLHGGNAACNGTSNNNGEDWYGKFTTSWQQGGFAFWLDPLNTGLASVNTYCAGNSSVSGGTGGGAGSYRCGTILRTDGFLINGVKDGVVEVCLNNGIKLSPISPHPTYPDKCNGYETFPITTFYEEGWCSNVENQLNVISCETSWFGLKCRCKFWKIFISITEVNNNLSPIGTEYFEWKSLSYDDIKNADFHTFPLLNYLPQNINLYPNKYYKIKLAGSNYSGWDEGTRYIHTYSENININGSNPTNNVYGKDITIQNSTITQPIEVVASESIHFLPGTHLTAGHYYIDENQNCNSFKMESMLRVGNNDIGNNKSTTSNYNKNELILSNQKTSDKSNNSINIYPNPTNGKFNINIDTNFEGLIELKLIDLLGNTILNNVGNKSNLSFDLSGYPKGIYLLKIIIDSKLNVQKIIYQ